MNGVVASKFHGINFSPKILGFVVHGGQWKEEFSARKHFNSLLPARVTEYQRSKSLTGAPSRAATVRRTPILGTFVSSGSQQTIASVKSSSAALLLRNLHDPYEHDDGDAVWPSIRNQKEHAATMCRASVLFFSFFSLKFVPPFNHAKKSLGIFFRRFVLGPFFPPSLLRFFFMCVSFWRAPAHTPARGILAEVVVYASRFDLSTFSRDSLLSLFLQIWRAKPFPIL